MDVRTTCRSCGARIVWVVSSRGKPMPIDAEPSANGNLFLSHPIVPGQSVARVVTGRTREALRACGEAFISHHATCPQARQWRRKNGEA